MPDLDIAHRGVTLDRIDDCATGIDQRDSGLDQGRLVGGPLQPVPSVVDTGVNQSDTPPDFARDDPVCVFGERDSFLKRSVCGGTFERHLQ